MEAAKIHAPLPTLRHLYRSKHLTTTLSSLVHCESYDFGLELETALAKAVDAFPHFHSPDYYGEANVFHLEWDNLNKITANIHGSNMENSTGGIMIQEVKHRFDTNQDRTLPIYKRNTRFLKVDTPETWPLCTPIVELGPNFLRGQCSLHLS